MKYNPTEGLELQDFHETHINWPQLIREIEDGYYDKGATLGHAVQKDAVQNGWDPRMDKRGAGWKFTFRLIEGPDLTLLTMTDEGTCGLTGRRLNQEDLEKDLPVGERWGRFENLAFRNESSPDRELLGSRGRGKFVFVAASNNMVIFYDSNRGGTYRFGQRHVEKTRSPTYAQDGENGKKDLIKKSRGLLEPLSNRGTRVVIVNPRQEVIQDIRNGNFAKYIGSTWWQIIAKLGTRIVVSYGKKEYDVKPFPETFPDKDSEKYKVWIKKNVSVLNQLGGENLKCKELCIVYSEKEVDEEIRGIAIQRSGMKICCLPVDDLGPELSKHIYGYVILEDEWNTILRHAEGLEHYSLNFKKHPANILKQFLVSNYHQFAKEKLGWGASAKQITAKKQKNAEKRALRAINRLVVDLGFNITGTGHITSTPDGGEGVEPPSLKKVRLRLERPKFPRENNLRVNYGETLENIATRAINDSEDSIEVKVKLYIMIGERDGKIVRTLFDDTVKLDAKSKSSLLGLSGLTFTEEEYPKKGKYFIVSEMVSLSGPTKGLELDEKKLAFFLEEDPPARGFFEKYEPMGFGELDHPYNTLMAAYETGTVGGYIIQYNVDHPEYAAIVDDEEAWTKYLFRIGIPQLCRIDIIQDQPVLFKKEHLDDSELSMRRMIEVIGESEAYLYEEGV